MPLGPTASGEDPFGSDLVGLSQIDDGNPFAKGSVPYSTPKPAGARAARPQQRGRTGAEIATMICGGCLIAYAAVQIIFVTISLFVSGAASFAVLDRVKEQGGNNAAMGIVAGQILAVVLSGVVMFTILAGGVQMIRFKVWGLCLAACILTMMPCSYLCILGLPIGIWGIVMLSLGSVRSAFH
ncbi:MAG: hypothetical protein HYV60_14750 [Planctomycetia bacterium]|nr:hypothetical protein [Planctomycetia bacterium]